MAFSSPEVDRLISAGPQRLPLTQADLRPVAAACSVGSQDATALFPRARHAQAALAGLLLRLGCWAESHAVAQDVESPEASYWHGILHRMEPDSFNAGYWFRRVGKHAIFPELFRRADGILKNRGPVHWQLEGAWDPLLFVRWCDEARQSRGSTEKAAIDIQMIEWELLFDWCVATQYSGAGS